MSDTENEPTIVPKTDPATDRTILSGSAAGNADGGAQSVPDQIGDYVIESEIARGGMGVVYKATHQRLARTVALKMILSGQFASAEEVQRFNQEAAAAAQLEHSGIVPIFEVGEFDGNHFFSMKFVEGGSLSEKLAEFRGDQKRGVKLLAEVARAIHFAHQRGILHRDLKPANILIDQETGNPVVTDFGLAKQVESESNITQSGAIVGTPSYMPPEQASGQEVTTAADVYSLGAILFEMITGQPPYKKDSALETLIAVVESEEPPRASVVSSSVDRGLEAIALKALQRDPADRYASAAALASDLEAWVDERPLSVRPPSVGNLLQLWFRQNLKSVAGSLVAGALVGAIVGLVVYYLFLAPNVARMATVYDTLEKDRPLFARKLPGQDWLGQGRGAIITTVLQYSLVALLAMVGFLNAWIVRPTTRASAIASGVIAGFMVSLMGFGFGVGWLLTSANSVSPQSFDIDLLSQAAWEHDGSPGAGARRALMYRHSGLKTMTPEERTRAMSSLIQSNQNTAIPVGLIGGMVMMFLLGMLPCVAGTILGASLLQSDRRVWMAGLKYSEVVVAASFAALFLMLFFIGPFFSLDSYRPSAWLRLLMVAVPVAASVAALRRKSGRLRIGLMMTSIALIGVYVYLANRNYQSVRNAGELVVAGEMVDAVEFLEHHVEALPAGSMAGQIRLAVIYGYLGRFDEYRDQADTVLVNNAGQSWQNNLCWLAWIAMAREGTAHLEVATELADVLDPASDPGTILNFRLVKATAALRNGQPEVALKWLDEQPIKDWFNERIALSIRVMALSDLGRTEEVREGLQKLEAYEERPLESDSWFLVMCAEIIRRDAIERGSATL